MKFLIHCLLAVVAFTVIEVRCNSLGQQYSLGVKVSSNRSSRGPLLCKNGNAGTECSEDCSTLMICSALKPEPLRHSTCAAPNKYCVNGACTSNQGNNCNSGGGSASDFQCTDVGVFPDPDDCTQYHVCESDGTADDYQCSPGFVFNSLLSVCQIGKTPCTKISCAKATAANPIVSYISNPAYYAFCMKNADGIFEATMFKCPYEQFEVFDLKTNECKFKCKAKGNFQNPAKCNEYFYCSGANAQPNLSICPTAWVFDGTGCNRDVLKCQFTPTTTTTTTTPDPLDKKTDADPATTNFILGLKSDILMEICKVDASVQQDADICPSVPATPTLVELVANHYRKEKDGDNIFVSVTIDTKDKHYHVKINQDSATTPPAPSVIKVNVVPGIDEEIVHFD